MPRRTWGVLGSLALAGGVFVAPVAVHADLAGPTTHVVQPGETLSQIALDAGLDSAGLASLNGLDDPNLLVAGQALKLPAGLSAPISASAPSAASPATGQPTAVQPLSQSARTYTVADGDTLWAIAQQFNTTTDALVQLNSLDDGDHLRAGAVLSVPSTTRPAAVAASTAAVTVAAPAAAATAVAPPKPAAARRTLTVTYTVQAGETLSRIARQFDVRADTIAQASGLDDPNKLSIGSVLKVPVPGKEHVVTPGETLRDIAAAEKVDLGALIDFNQLDDPELIRVGEVVVVPVPATGPAPSAGNPPSADSAPAAGSAPSAGGAATGPAALTSDAAAPAPTAAKTAAPTSPPSAPAPAATTVPAPAATATAAPSAPGQVAAAASPQAAQAAQAAARPAPKPAAPVAVLPPPPGAPTDGLAGASLKLLGTPYVWGGSSPSGFDCSGFVWYVARQAGKSVSRGMLGEFNAGSHPAREELKPGDLVFFQNTFTPGLSHNGIYIGNGQFVHAADEAAGVTISSLNTAYWSGHWFGATRLP